MELLQVSPRRASLLSYHVGILHCHTRGTVGDATAHRSRGLGKADVSRLAGDNVFIIALVLYGDTVVIIDARQRRLVGIVHVFVVARRTVDVRPGFVFLLSGSAVYDVGLSLVLVFLQHLPRQFHRARVDTLRGLERDEPRLAANGHIVERRLTILFAADGALYSVVVRITTVQSFLGIATTVLTAVDVLVAVLPGVARLICRRRDGIDG